LGKNDTLRKILAVSDLDQETMKEIVKVNVMPPLKR